MLPANELPTDVWVVAGILATGLVSTWLARLNEGSSWQGPYYGFFLLCLVVVAGLTVAALSMGPGHWIASGATLSVMAVAATCDFGTPAPPR